MDRFLANASRRFSTEGRRGFGATPGGVVADDEDLGDLCKSKLYFLCCSALPRILDGRHPCSSNDRRALYASNLSLYKPAGIIKI